VPATTPFQPSIILLVEDEENDVLLLQIAFEKAGVKWPIFRVANGLEAQAYLNGDPPYQDRKRYPLPSLVLLDVRMPLMDGFQVLRWIRQQPAFVSMPVVMLTGSAQTNDADTAYQLGANSFLVKPMDFNNAPEMSRSIERLMQPS
jgi:CheY-like chemotaxis protein